MTQFPRAEPDVAALALALTQGLKQRYEGSHHNLLVDADVERVGPK